FLFQELRGVAQAAQRSLLDTVNAIVALFRDHAQSAKLTTRVAIAASNLDARESGDEDEKTPLRFGEKQRRRHGLAVVGWKTDRPFHQARRSLVPRIARTTGRRSSFWCGPFLTGAPTSRHALVGAPVDNGCQLADAQTFAATTWRPASRGTR